MAIQYTTWQDKRKNGTSLFYGRVVHPNTVNLDAIASRIEKTCSMTKGDVLAVLTELVSVMTYELQNSNKVKIDGLGTFYMMIKSTGAETDKKFTAADNIKNCITRFLPEGKKTNGKMTRTFAEGIKYVKSV